MTSIVSSTNFAGIDLAMGHFFRHLFILMILFFSLSVYSQPPGGPPGGGGGPGGGNGNDPCARTNPPPSCDKVPIDDYVEYLFIGGALLGLYYVRRKSFEKIKPESE